MSEWRLKLEFCYLDPTLECLYPSGDQEWSEDEPYVVNRRFTNEDEARAMHEEAKEILSRDDSSDMVPSQAQQDFATKHGFSMLDSEGNDYEAKLALNEILEFVKVENLETPAKDPPDESSLVSALNPGPILSALCLAGVDLLESKGTKCFRFNKEGKFWQASVGGRMCDKPQGIGGGACGECEACMESRDGGRWRRVNQFSERNDWTGWMVEALWPYHVELVRDESMEAAFCCFLHPNYGVDEPLQARGEKPHATLAKGIAILAFELYPEEMKKVWKALGR